MKRYAGGLAMGWVRVLTALLLAALIVGCSSSSPGDETTHYLLTDQSAVVEPGGGRQLLRVERVALASYLDGEGIVMQTSEVAIRAARNHLWADDLAAQLHRDLMGRLAEQLDGVRVLGPDQRVRGPGREVMELTVTLDRFQGRFDGYAVVGGKWQLLDDQGEVRAGQRFRRERPLERDGYPALVSSLKQAWMGIVAGIADGVSQAGWPDGSSDS
jgi:uncharacterized lipoprotein YmbA